MTAQLRRPIQVFIASLLIAFPLTFWNSAKAQTPEVDPRPPLAQQPERRVRIPRILTPASGRQQQIARMVQEIDPRNIERTIRKLVSFGTRNTLSTQSDPNRGVGAARDWLFSEFS